MTPRPLFLALAACAATLSVWVLRPGLNPAERLLLWRYAGTTFSAVGWNAGDPGTRGAMTADLLRRHRFIGRDYHAVFAMLGPATCYAGYEDEPCYLVKFAPGKVYHLAFPVSHSSRPGRVLDMTLRGESKGADR